MSHSRTPRRDFLKALGLGAAATALPGPPSAAGGAAAKGAKGKPNIVLILTDDQGWTHTSVPMMRSRGDSRSDLYRAPALERMAKEGMVFSNAYAAAPTCTPSRGSIQFGKTPARLKQTVVHDVLAKSRAIDCRGEVSIAQMIRSADRRYVTAHFGKWGFCPRPPEHAGYDVTDGSTNNADGDWLSKKDGKPVPQDDPKRIFSLTRRAAAFMARCVAAGRPFFMQVSHYALHVRHHALKETIAKYEATPAVRDRRRLLYAAMIEDLDRSLGMLLAEIDKLGIAPDTYVIFTSDNGGGFGGNAPLKGGKARLWEGGIRVPTVVRGPGVRAGCQCDVPIAGWDFFPTISDLVGSTKSLPAGIDGGSLRPLFEKGNEGRVERGTEGLVFHFPWYDSLPMSAIRLGDFKLVRNLNTGETRLFNLAKDIAESTDLSRSMPQKAAELEKRLTDYLRAVDAEGIEDMRAERRKELLGRLKLMRKEIEQLRESLAKAPGGKEKEKLRAELAVRQDRLKTHAAALGRLEKAGRITSW